MRVSVVAVGVTCVVLGAAAAFAAPAPANPEDVTAVLKALEAPFATEAPRLLQSDDGYIRYLGAPPGGKFIAPASAKTPDPATNARDFLTQYGAAFAAPDAHVQLEVSKVTTTDSRHYVKMKQTYGGKEVFASGVVVQVDDAGGIVAIISDIMHGLNTDSGDLALTPAIGSSIAQQIAIKRVSEEVDEAKGLQLVASAPQLEVFEPTVVGTDGPTRLVYYTEVSSPDAIDVKLAVFVDALTGQVPLYWSLIHTIKDRKVYDGGSIFSLGANLVRSEGSEPSGIKDVDDAYDCLGDTYDFYFDHHGRDAIDGLGGTMTAYVRIMDYGGIEMQNAFWDGMEMVFGNGYTVDDVTSHELTHGVTEFTSGLIYMFESGAINESFSDMWGEWVDLSNTGGNDSDEVRWLIGEDLPTSPIRNMKDPTEFGDPDRYSAYLDYPIYFDMGGVHFNSGIGNKLCYLLTDGDTFNGQTIQGMGIPRTADLFYEAQTNLLSSGADYYDLYAALSQASINLDFTFQERLNLRAAMAAVEIIPDSDLTGLKNFRATPAYTADGIPVVVITWQNPETDGAIAATLIRSTHGFKNNIPEVDAQSDANGVIIYEGQDALVIDGIESALEQGREYFYSLFIDVEGGLPYVAYARATGGDNPPDYLTEAYSIDRPIDLAFSQLLFTPIIDAAAAEASGRFADYVNYTNYIVTKKTNITQLPVARNDNDGLATHLILSDDDTVTYTLGSFAFPFFGTAYNRAYVSSNGYITFNTSDDFPSVDAHFAAPRISFLFADLAPNVGGTVWGRGLDDRLVITFDHVPEYAAFSDYTVPGPNTVQLELFYSGHIRVTYLAVNVEEAMVGLSDGRGTPPDLETILPGTPSTTDLSDMSEARVHFTEALDIWPPVPLQIVNEGEVVEFDVATVSPAGTVPVLEATWDLEIPVPFANHLDGTGHFRWETQFNDGGLHSVLLTAETDTEAASQSVLIYVVDTWAAPEARNLVLRSEDPEEDPSLSRLVSARSSLTAEYEYWHPESTEDPMVFGEGSSLVYWFRNGILVPSLTNQPRVPTGMTRSGEIWYYTVTPETQFFVRGATYVSPTVTVVDLPTILEVSPISGPMTGGTEVHIRGTNLDVPMRVRFGGFDAQSIIAVSDEELIAVTPVRAPGTVEIEVDTYDGTGRMDSCFTFTGDGGAIVRADINGDGVVTAVDVQLVINGVLGIEKNFDVDANRDGIVNAADIQVVVNTLLSAG